MSGIRYKSQINMPVPPTEPNHVIRKQELDARGPDVIFDQTLTQSTGSSNINVGGLDWGNYDSLRLTVTQPNLIATASSLISMSMLKPDGVTYIGTHVTSNNINPDYETWPMGYSSGAFMPFMVMDGLYTESVIHTEITIKPLGDNLLLLEANTWYPGYIAYTSTMACVQKTFGGVTLNRTGSGTQHYSDIAFIGISAMNISTWTPSTFATGTAIKLVGVKR